MALSRKPSLEGSLAIFNVLSLLAFFILTQSIDGSMWLRTFEPAIVVWMWILSIPISGFCFLLLARHGSGIELILLCGVAGINAILWGHGLAWILRKTLLARYVVAASEGEESNAASDDDPPAPSLPE